MCRRFDSVPEHQSRRQLNPVTTLRMKPGHSTLPPISASELSSLVTEGLSIAQISTRIGRSKTTVRHWLAKHALKTANPRFYPHPANFNEERRCTVCAKPVSRRWLCQGCYTKVRRYRQKRRAVELMGGSCTHCGWTGPLAGYQFHHVSGEKEFNIAKVANKSWSVIVAELKKCVLLCGTCHLIEHSNHEGKEFLEAVARYKGTASIPSP